MNGVAGSGGGAGTATGGVAGASGGVGGAGGSAGSGGGSSDGWVKIFNGQDLDRLGAVDSQVGVQRRHVQDLSAPIRSTTCSR